MEKVVKETNKYFTIYCYFSFKSRFLSLKFKPLICAFRSRKVYNKTPVPTRLHRLVKKLKYNYKCIKRVFGYCEIRKNIMRKLIFSTISIVYIIKYANLFCSKTIRDLTNEIKIATQYLLVK